MSEDKSLVPCKGCGMSYEFKMLYDVEGQYEYDNPVTVWICGPCYDKWVNAENPWRDKDGLPI